MSNFKSSDKVWVYTSPVLLSEEQKGYILSKAEEFLNDWESHGAKVKGEIGVAYDHFVIIVADDCDGSMCGRAQDAQIRFVKELGAELGLDLTDRMQMAYRSPVTNEIEVKKMNDFRADVALGEINENTIVFNNMVTTFGEFNSGWEIPLKESWHKQLLV